MAAPYTPADNSEYVTLSKEVFSEFFVPEDKLDQPYDVVLVAENGKEFKAHRQVLSEASPFFEKLLSSDMKESKEGIVRLEMFSESVVGSTLEFIYTGHVRILTEDNARDLIVMADYLFLKNLKTLAEEVLQQKLNPFKLYFYLLLFRKISMHRTLFQSHKIHPCQFQHRMGSQTGRNFKYVEGTTPNVDFK